MNKKKGFTLIELLAIIIILGIIAVITVPIILNVTENAKKGAITNSAYGYKEAIEKYDYDSMLNDSNYDNMDGDYSINSNGHLAGTNAQGDSVTYNILFTGNKPTRGFLTIKNSEITGCIQYDEYKVEIKDGEILSTEKEECQEPNYARNAITLNPSATSEEGRSPYINYVDPNGTTILCRALYNDSTHGLQIVTSDIVQTVNIGVSDPLYNIENAFEKALASYNNAIENLNNYAMAYLNTKYATDARSIGSVSTVTNGMMANKNDEELLANPNNYSYLNSFVESETKGTDNHYGDTDGTDLYTMNSLQIAKITGKEYWLASRLVDTNPNFSDFYIRRIGGGGGQIYSMLFRSAGNMIAETSAGLRVVFLLKEDVVIKSGTGTLNDPYVLG